MLYGEIVTLSYEIRTEHTNTTCGQNVQFMNVKPQNT
jgi:hypothetical protein